MDEMNFGVDQLVRIVRRRAKLVAACAALFGLVGLFVASLLPNRYQAVATVLVEPQTISSNLVEAGLEAGNLQNRLHLMAMQILARERLSRVIDDFGLYPESHREKTRLEIIEEMREDIRVDPVLPEMDRELFKRTDPEINTFRLTFEHESAGVAAQVTNRLANDFIDQHIRDRAEISSDTAAFIQTELARLDEQLRKKQQEIESFKEEKAGRLPEDRAPLQRRLELVLSSMRRAQDQAAEAQSDATYLRQQALAAAQAKRDEADPARKIQLLEISLAEMRARGLTDRHPDMVAAKEEMTELQAIVDAGGFGKSSVQRTAEAQAKRAEERGAAALLEFERLEAERAEVEARLAEIPRVAEHLESLENDERSLLASVHEFRSKQVSASVAANMVQGLKGEQFRVLERAVPPPKPAEPNRPLVVLFATFLGLVLGGGFVLLMEVADTSYQSARDVQQSLRIPVLATVPSIVLDADRRTLKRRQLVELVAASTFAVVLLAGSWVAYKTVNTTPAAPQAAVSAGAE